MFRRRFASLVLLALIITLGALGCGGGSTWCADCEVATSIVRLNYQSNLTYTQGSPITVNLPNPTGGTPSNYTVTSGSLPPGLTLDPISGQITGTPTVPGVYTLTLQGSNKSNAVTQTIVLTVLPSAFLSLAYASPQVFPASVAIPNQAATLSQATPGLLTTYAITTGSLPQGLILNPDGPISGTPTAAGVFSFTVTATNSTRSAQASATYTVTPAGTFTLNYATPLIAPTGSPIPIQVPVLSHTTPGVATTFTITAGSLPPGLTLNLDGTITGTPTTPGSYAVTITATNGTLTAASSLIITVPPAAALSLSYVTPQVFAAGTPITARLATLGNATPGITTTFSLSLGSLPDGLALQADGSITGTPLTPGVSLFAITAINGSRSVTANLSYTVTPSTGLGLAYTTPVTFAAGTSITAQSAALNNATPGVLTTYAVTSGTLPTGLTLNADGTITGTPTTPGVTTFTVTATNGARTATSSPTYTVTPSAALTESYPASPVFVAGTPISLQAPTITNATPGITTTYAVTSGTLPAGLTLNTDGTITGTPTTPGVTTFTVTATNGARTATSTPTYTVTPSATLTESYPASPVFVAGTPISLQAPTIANATPGITTTYAVTSGTLPAGLTLNADGTITGTPTTPGVTTFTVTATNGARTATSTPTYTVTPSAALTVGYTTPVTFTAGSVITSQTASVSNATPGLSTTFAVTSGTLPTGLTIDASTGAISGNPSAPGVYAFTVTATNGARTATSSPTYTVTPAAALTVGYTTPVTFTAGSAITSQTASVSNATPGLSTTYAVTSGSLPTGLTIDASTGAISGNPSAPGVYAFTVTATNGARTATSSPTYTVTPAAALTVGYTTPVTFPISVGITAQTPTVSNATPGLSTTFAVTSGSLPTGLAIDASSGAISGTPTAGGVSAFTVTATNGARTAAASLSYTVSAAPTALNYTTPATYPEQSLITPNLPNPSGGAPTSYAVTLGTLPTGLVLNSSTGIISGTPAGPTASPVSVTITGTNSYGGVFEVVVITVSPIAPTSLNYTTPNTYTNGTAITANLPNPLGGTPTSYVVSSGILPIGLSINPTTGVLSGTPTAPTAGLVQVTIRGSNGTGLITQTISITVNDTAPTALNYTTPNTYTDGTPILVNNPNPTGGTPSSYAITGGALPAGLTLNATTGVISGTPAGAQTALSVTITGTNGVGSAFKAITNTVTATAPTALHYATPSTYIMNTVIPNNSPNPVGGTPASYAITAGSLPAGLHLDLTTGDIYGTPTATTAGPVSVTIKGTNPSGNVSQTISINVPLPIVVSFSGNPVLLPVGQIAQLTAVFAGGVGSIDNSIGTIQSGGNIYTPAVATPQSITYTLTVTNGSSPIVTAPVTIQWVNSGTTLTVPVSLSGGGGIDYTDPGHIGDPFYGLKLVIPSQGAVCDDTNLTIMKEASAPSTAPSPALIVSQTYNFTTTIGYPFKKPITVTLPYDTTSLVAGDVPIVFYWDPAYNVWVANGVKSFDAVAKEVTFTTLLPGRYTVMAIPSLASTLSNAATAFVSTTDGWFQPNQGVFDQPGGSSFGMSAFASWYYKDRKSTNANTGLYSLFRQGPIASDDVAAKALISRLANGTNDSWSQIVNQTAYQLTDKQTGLALITALKVTGQPQIFLMGDTRPVTSNALATVVYDYNATTKKFSVMDPNYPGVTLTITWDPVALTNGWTAYERSQGYFPAFKQYAFEGHTSIHRLVDYERAFQGANTDWPAPPFAVIHVANVGNLASPSMTAGTLNIADVSSVGINGTVTNGDDTATYIYWNQNGGPRTAVGMVGTSFILNVGALEDPYGTRIMLETTTNPCDPTFSHSGFQEFYVKDQALSPWFANSCFENGLKADGKTPQGWTTEQGSNGGVYYPTNPTFDAQGRMSGYAPAALYTPTGVASPSAGSALATVGNDPTCTITPLPMVLDGTASFRVNHIGSGSELSRAYQTFTVPTIVAHPQLSFYWSAVLENAGHPAQQQPYADILLQDITDPNNVSTVYFFHIAAQDPNYPGWQVNGTWGAIPWQKVSLPNMTAYKGHTLKLTVTAADCTQGGHGGYVYLDNIACN